MHFVTVIPSTETCAFKSETLLATARPALVFSDTRLQVEICSIVIANIKITTYLEPTSHTLNKFSCYLFLPPHCIRLKRSNNTDMASNI